MPIATGNRAELHILGTPRPGNRAELHLGYVEPPPDPPTPVARGLRASVSSRWQEGIVRRTDRRARWKQAQIARLQRVIPWRQHGSAEVRRAITTPWQSPRAVRIDHKIGWSNGTGMRRRWQVLWAAMETSQVSARALWLSKRGSMIRSARVAWARAIERREALVSRWRVPGDVRRRAWRVPQVAPVMRVLTMRIRWQEGRRLAWIVRAPPVPPPPPRPPGIALGNRAALRLECPIAPGNRAGLSIGWIGCYHARPLRTSVVIVHSVRVRRLPDLTEIDVLALTLSGAVDEWCWSMRMTLASAAQLPILAPLDGIPRSVEIEIDGYRWVMLVEQLSDGSEFGATQASVFGRSRTALLAEPYASVRSHEQASAKTMAQLAADVLTGSGFTVDYDAVSWVVPTGTWSYVNLTPMAALQRLAEASGAVVQSARESDALVIRPRYPAAPWDWAAQTPAGQLIGDVLFTTSTQREQLPMHDAIIVAGEQGTTARVRLSGTAGQDYAPQIIDRLITHADAARERGRNALSARGEIHTVQATAPLFADPIGSGEVALVEPMTLHDVLLESESWRGQVDRVEITVVVDEQKLTVTQQLTLARHFTDAG